MNEVMTVAQRVRRIIAENLGVDVADVTDEKKPADLAGDSLGDVRCLVAIERELGIDVSENDALKLWSQTVGEWIQYFEALRSAKHA